MVNKTCPTCGQEMEEKFDWSLMPIDTIVEVITTDGAPKKLRYVGGVSKKGIPRIYPNGISSLTHLKGELFNIYSPCKILAFKNNPIRPWFGGECPVHPDVLVKVFLKDDVCIDEVQAGKCRWNNEPYYPTDIYAYQILDQEIPG